MVVVERHHSKEDRARVFIVDDHPIARYGVAQLISHEQDLMVCGEAEDAIKALEAIGTVKPDIVIVDISLGDTSGIELIKDIRIRYRKLPVLVLSMHSDPPYAERAFRAGARGYVAKREVTGQVVKAIRQVLDGEIYVSEQLAVRFVEDLVEGRVDTGGFPMDRLSDRELQVFKLVGQGYRTSQIAEALHVGVKTVESYRERIKGKLKLKRGTELLQLAIQWVQGQKG